MLFALTWQMLGPKLGASALNLQKTLGLKRYATVWNWHHKLRKAMVREEREPLSGLVEIDDSYVGGEEKGVRGRQTKDKSIVMIAVEVKEIVIKKGKNKGQIKEVAGRVRMERLPDLTEKSVLAFISRNITPGTVIRSDGHKSFQKLPSHGYQHVPYNIKRSGAEAHELLPHVHRVAALLKRWWLGTHQGSIRKQHLCSYLDEFAFRYNRRSSIHRGLLFYRLVKQAVQMQPFFYDQINRGDYNMVWVL